MTLRGRKIKIEILTDSDRKFSEKSNETNYSSIGAKLTEIQPFEVEKVKKPLFEKTAFEVLPLNFCNYTILDFLRLLWHNIRHLHNKILREM